jgi:hypothetical protein
MMNKLKFNISVDEVKDIINYAEMMKKEGKELLVLEIEQGGIGVGISVSTEWDGVFEDLTDYSLW